MWLLLMAAAAAALVLLAWLEYRWIGRVSEAEHERMRMQLNAAVWGFARQADDEVWRTLGALVPGPVPEHEELDQVAARYARWRESASNHRLIKSLYAVRRGGGGGLEILRCDLPAGFRAAVWPEEFADLRARLERGLPIGVAVEDRIPAIAAPRLVPPWMRRPGPPVVRWVLVLVLDLDFVRREMFPELAGKYFPATSGLDFQVRIVSAADRARVIYQSDPGLGAAFFANPDAQAMTLTPRFGGGRRAAPGHDPGHWRVLVKNRSGSLEAVVAQARLRNLALSFAILLLMGAAMAVVVLYTRRTQQLAARQLEFVAGVSHELRTPLTVICSAADNLADGLVGNERQARRYGSLIRNEGRRLTRMVEQILAFAGIRSGRARFEFEPVDVEDLIQKVVADSEGEIRAGGCRVETSIAPDLPPVMADSVALTHCLRNLLENAAVHGKAGGWIGVRVSAASGQVEIRVEDRGEGIDRSDMPHIFDPFYRGRRAVKDQYRGFGLGLALVKRIVEAHSGGLHAESVPAKGTAFILRIPAAKVGGEKDGGTQDPAD